MARIDERQNSGTRIEKSQKQGDEHPFIVVLAKFAINGFRKLRGLNFVGTPFPPELDGDPHEAARAGHEHRRRGPLTGHIADQKTKGMIARVEKVVKIAADFARRLHEGVDGHRLGDGTGRKLTGQHAELQRARGVHLFLQPCEISLHFVAQTLLFQ